MRDKFSTYKLLLFLLKLDYIIKNKIRSLFTLKYSKIILCYITIISCILFDIICYSSK